jgi:predicted Zn-dependent protease
MTARVLPVMIALVLAVAGCVSDEKKLTTVSPSPFGQPVHTQAASFKEAPPATQKVALRVNDLGHKIVAANPRLNQQVVFLTLGVPQLEIFHRVQKDSRAIYITEGLVNQCKTDNELAALLCQELGKMTSEQIVQVKPERKLPEPPPLISPRVGNDIGFASADRTDLMVLGHMEKERRQAQQALAPPPPPEALARAYLQNAGYSGKDLDAVTPLLRQADQNDSLEQQMIGKPGR